MDRINIISWILIVFGITGMIGAGVGYLQMPQLTTGVNTDLINAANSLDNAAGITGDVCIIIDEHKDTIKDLGNAVLSIGHTMSNVGTKLQETGETLSIIRIPHGIEWEFPPKITWVYPFGQVGGNIINTGLELQRTGVTFCNSGESLLITSSKMDDMSKKGKELSVQLRQTSYSLKNASRANIFQQGTSILFGYIALLHLMFLLIGIALRGIKNR